MKNKTSKFGFILIAIIFFISIIIALLFKVSLNKVIINFNYDVIIILICMELFTNLVCKTGIIERISLKLSSLSKGKLKSCLWLFGLLMFSISAFLNNITAVLMILPIIFVLFKSIGIEKKYFNIFFAVILAMSNTGGASSPIGDFPAIVIMSSGITSFKGYLLRAFPLFLITSIIILLWWNFKLKCDKEDTERKELAIDLLTCKYKYAKVNKKAVIGLIIILGLMLFSWIFIPASIMPTELIALLGFIGAMLYCTLIKIDISLFVDFKSVLTISSFIFLATIISLTGYLEQIAIFLQNNINDPKTLLIIIMIFTSIFAGLFGAGPTATAMMPIIIYLCNTSFSDVSDWIAVAYAASICAGSSLFMWSATAGLILSKKIDDEKIIDEVSKKQILWHINDYFKYGLQNYFIQLFIGILIIYLVI